MKSMILVNKTTKSRFSLSEILVSADAFRFAHLNPQEVRTLREHHPELRGAGEDDDGAQAITVSGAPAVLSAVQGFLEHLAREGQQTASVLAALAPDPERAIITTERLAQIHLQVEARNAFVDAVPMFTSAMIGEVGGSSAKNASAMASRWKSAGRIFAVPSGRTDLYPAFQFDEDGKPRPAIAEVLRQLAGESDWAIALWWTAPSGWLDGRLPLSVLDTDPQAVIDAARRTAEPLEV